VRVFATLWPGFQVPFQELPGGGIDLALLAFVNYWALWVQLREPQAQAALHFVLRRVRGCVARLSRHLHSVGVVSLSNLVGKLSGHVRSEIDWQLSREKPVSLSFALTDALLFASETPQEELARCLRVSSSQLPRASQNRLAPSIGVEPPLLGIVSASLLGHSVYTSPCAASHALRAYSPTLPFLAPAPPTAAARTRFS